MNDGGGGLPYTLFFPSTVADPAHLLLPSPFTPFSPPSKQAGTDAELGHLSRTGPEVNRSPGTAPAPSRRSHPLEANQRRNQAPIQ
ncbi:hypothetical protein BS78_04G224600 [Paspalum vaginatum]|nr:hypothetical protein BS78_04G224600 [Paspalum vaginatum]